MADQPIPLRPRTKRPRNLVTIGGDIPWSSVSLSISADDLNPDAVTRLLGIRPDLAYRRGDVTVVRGRPIAPRLAASVCG